MSLRLTAGRLNPLWDGSLTTWNSGSHDGLFYQDETDFSPYLITVLPKLKVLMWQTAPPRMPIPPAI